MTHGYWLAPFGWGIFFVGLVVAIIMFAIKKRFYPVMYLISITTYIFTVGFVIDRFDMGKNSTLLILAFSSLVFILLGLYFTSKFSRRKNDMMNELPDKRGKVRFGK